MPPGNKPQVRRLPEEPVRFVLEVREDLMIPVLLQYVGGESRWGIRCDPTDWYVNIRQHGRVCLPAAGELPRPLTSVHGEKDRNVDFHWKDNCSITLCYPLSNDLSSFKRCEHKQVPLEASREQNKAIFILLCHQDINPQAARQILKLLQWWWKGGWICGHSGSTQCDFLGIRAHFSGSHLLALTMTLSSIVDNKVTPEQVIALVYKMLWHKEIQIKDWETFEGDSLQAVLCLHDKCQKMSYRYGTCWNTLGYLFRHDFGLISVLGMSQTCLLLWDFFVLRKTWLFLLIYLIC